MNKFIQPVFLVVFLISLSAASFAQEVDSTNTETPHYKHSIGTVITSTSGIGMSYRYRLEKSFGVQFSYLPLIERTNGSTTNQAFGLMFLYTFYEAEKSNFYVYQGNSLWTQREQYYYYNSGGYYQYDEPESHSYYRTYLNHGLGLGMEFLIQERGGFNLQIGLGSYDNFTSILPAGGISLFYKL